MTHSCPRHPRAGLQDALETMIGSLVNLQHSQMNESACRAFRPKKGHKLRTF